MSSKAYIVSWIGKGNIIWTPIEQSSSVWKIANGFDGPLRVGLDNIAGKSELVSAFQKTIDPVLANLKELQGAIQLTQNLTALSVGLNLVQLSYLYQISCKIDRLSIGVDKIIGKFDLHFLDQSLNFFQKSHNSHVGLIAPIANSLQTDCFVALQSLLDSPNLQIPAYLSLRLDATTVAIEAWSELIYATLNKGNFERISSNQLDSFVRNTQHWPIGGLPNGQFAFQRDIMKAWAMHMKEQPTEDKGWWTKIIPNRMEGLPLLERAMLPENFDRCRSLTTLIRELDCSIHLTEKLAVELEHSKDRSKILELIDTSKSEKVSFWATIKKLVQ